MAYNRYSSNKRPLRLLLFEKGCGSPQRTRFARTFARLFSHL